MGSISAGIFSFELSFPNAVQQGFDDLGYSYTLLLYFPFPFWNDPPDTICNQKIEKRHRCLAARSSYRSLLDI